MLDVILIIVSALCMIAGLAGCVLPFLPGPPIAYLGLVFLHFTDKVHYTPTQLIIWLLIVAVVQVLDYFTPMLGSKYSGGSKWGNRDPCRTSFLALGCYSRSVSGSSDW
jgi:uncharacterized protein YqgC (DUF456 family)